jgi:hypothetical protein
MTKEIPMTDQQEMPEELYVILTDRAYIGSPHQTEPEDVRYIRADIAQPRPDLVEVAQAVVDRWNTPLWKDVPATAHYINALEGVLKAVNTSENEGKADDA